MEQKYSATDKVLSINANRATSTLQTAANTKGGHQQTLLALALIHPDSSYAGLSARVQCNSLNVYLEMIENVINTCLRAANAPCMLRSYKLNDQFLASYLKHKLNEIDTRPYSADEYGERMFILDVKENTSSTHSECVITFHKLNELQSRNLTISYGTAK